MALAVSVSVSDSVGVSDSAICLCLSTCRLDGVRFLLKCDGRALLADGMG